MSPKSFRRFLPLFILAFAVPIQAQYTVLHHFAGAPSDGRQAGGDLVRIGTAFYGTSIYGGTSDWGTIYKIEADGTGFALLHSFTGGAGDGDWPEGSLILFKGKLYGMAHYGGNGNFGVIYRINPDGTEFTVLHSFAGGNDDGAHPSGRLFGKGSDLFGMTKLGGPNNMGTIFKMKADGSGFGLLHSFAGGAADGAYPGGGPLIFSGGKLYGMTRSGGAAKKGVIFAISPKGTGFKILHVFTGGAADGREPWGGLVAKGTALYGMAENGGEEDAGVVFKLKKDGTGFAILHSFGASVTNGWGASGSLIFGGKMLYGFTVRGGANSNGTIFRIKTDGTGFTLLHSLGADADEGDELRGTPVRWKSAKYGTLLLGMTRTGGSFGNGVIFSYREK